MESIKIKSTSKSSAITDDVVLRETKTTRLIFRPLIIDNVKEHDASVKGEFVFQRKNLTEEWEDYNELYLSSLKATEWIKLNLKGVEVLKLYKRLSDLYSVYEKGGIPSGSAQYLRIDEGLGALLTATEDDLHELFNKDIDDGATLFARLLNWFSSLNTPTEVLDKLEQLNVTNLQQIRSIIGLSALKSILDIWNENKDNSSEEFWQNTLKENSFVLSQVFAYPVILVEDKAYVGGKKISNKGGNLLDFLAKNEISKNAVLIEIKTPATELLGGKYRTNAYSISSELSGAIVQVANYRISLQKDYDDLVEDRNDMQAFEPSCVVIVGNYSNEIGQSTIKKKSLELFRSNLRDIEIITYDELFGKVRLLIDLFEGTFNDAVNESDEHGDFPF